MHSQRPVRVALLVATGVIAVMAVALFIYLWNEETQLQNVGEDYRFYVSLGQRFLDTGVLYGERQLTGMPYHVEINVDNLYPPPAILLFIPFVYLPAITWFAIPVLAVAATMWWFRPSLWTWPLIALCLLWPRTQDALIVGNSDIWSAAFVAAGTMLAWPSILGLFKPAFAPFALIGIRHRSWWVTLAIAVVVSLLFLPYWSQFITAATNWDLPITRSIANTPILFIPILAWVGRTRHRATRTEPVVTAMPAASAVTGAP